MVLNFHPKLMRTNLELVERDLDGMHPLTKCISWFDNDAVFYLHEMFSIKGHLGLEAMGWIHPNDLDVPFVSLL